MAKYKTCPWLEHGIVFDHCNIVRNCSHFNPSTGGRPVIYENYHGELFDWDKFWALKNSYRENAKRNELPSQCIDCMCLHEKECEEASSRDEKYIDRILLTPWVECNSRCLYCSAPTETFVLENTKSFKVLPVMQDFIENNVFSEDVSIDFAGGEPTIYPEFDKLLDLFVSKGFKDIVVHTNAIRFSKSIENAIKKMGLKLLISVDSATKEMHEKIKGVKTYDQVWKSIKKYAKAQKKDKSLVRLKYIILPGVNDNRDELEKWLLKCKKTGINDVVLNIDFNWLIKYINDVPQEIRNLVNDTQQKAEELGMNLVLYPQLIEIQRKYENCNCSE